METITRYCGNFPQKNFRPFITFSTIQGGDTDAECFYDYYTANGWRTGKNPIKDWKAAARNWMRRKPEFSNTIQNQTNHETKRTYQDL